MLNRIRGFFEEHLLPGQVGPEADPDHVLRLAVSALLLEMSRMDGDVRPDERQAVEEAVRTCFDLSAAETTELLELAEAERADSTDYYQFTRLINGSYSLEQKVKLIEVLWRVAYATEGLHMYEEHLARKVAELLYVPHSAFIAAKHRARGQG